MTIQKWIEPSDMSTGSCRVAVSDQQLAKSLYLMSFADNRMLIADGVHPKTSVTGWTLTEDETG